MFKRILSLMFAIVFAITITGCGGISAPPNPGEKSKLARVTDDHSIVGGVCSGFAYFTGTQVWMWRTAFVVLTLCGGSGILAYLILWMFMPEFSKTPVDFEKRVGQ